MVRAQGYLAQRAVRHHNESSARVILRERARGRRTTGSRSRRGWALTLFIRIIKWPVAKLPNCINIRPIKTGGRLAHGTHRPDGARGLGNGERRPEDKSRWTTKAAPWVGLVGLLLCLGGLIVPRAGGAPPKSRPPRLFIPRKTSPSRKSCPTQPGRSPGLLQRPRDPGPAAA